MTDKDIRAALLLHLRAHDPEAVIFEELPLSRGEGRADCAAVNGHLCGYEIKSERDSLGRLTRQIGYYNRIFEFCTVVIAEKHLPGVRKLIPAQWGIMIANHSDQSVVIRSIRKPRKNGQANSADQLRLLWARELKVILRNSGLPNTNNDLIANLWESASKISSRSIIVQVRDALKLRGARQAAAR